MIRDITEDANVSDVFLVKDCSCLKTKKDKRPYTALMLTDKSGEIKAYVWDSHLNHIRAGTFVKASGTARKHQGSLVLRLTDTGITPVPKPDNLDRYIHSLDAITINSLWEELLGYANGLQDKYYKAIILYLVNNADEFGEEFNIKTCPLTDERWGNYAGALLEHIVYCLRHCKAIHQNYFDRNCPLDPDLMTAIVILHDIGKLKTYKNIYAVEQTVNAKLMSVYSLTVGVLFNIISKVEMAETDWDATKAGKLMDGINTMAMDTKAKTIEALVVQGVVQLDVKVGIYARALNFAKADQEFVYDNTLNTEIFNG